MPIRVNVPGIGTVNFPDGMPEEQIAAEVQKLAAQVPNNAPEEPKSVGGFFSNLVSSGGRAIGDTASMLGTAAKVGLFGGRNPLTGELDPTLRGLGQAAASPLQTASALKDYASERYGGINETLNTLYTDPVGAGMDLSTLLGGGALAASKLGATGAKVANVMRAADPITQASSLAGKAGRAVGGSTQNRGRWLMEQALKMNERQKIDMPDMPQTALDYGINRSSGGRQKLDRLMEPRKERKGALVDESPLTFDAQDPANFPQSRDQMELAEFESSVAPDAAKQSEQVLRDFQAAPKYQGEAPVSFASKDKTRIYKGLGDNAYANAIDQKPRGTVDAQKALASDLKAIEEQVPGVAALNAELSPMYDLRTHLVKTLGPGGAGFPYPSGGGVTRTIGSALLPYGESLAARGVYQTGRGIAKGASALEQQGPTLARLSALQRAIMSRQQEQ